MPFHPALQTALDNYRKEKGWIRYHLGQNPVVSALLALPDDEKSKHLSVLECFTKSTLHDQWRKQERMRKLLKAFIHSTVTGHLDIADESFYFIFLSLYKLQNHVNCFNVVEPYFSTEDGLVDFIQMVNSSSSWINCFKTLLRHGLLDFLWLTNILSLGRSDEHKVQKVAKKVLFLQMVEILVSRRLDGNLKDHLPLLLSAANRLTFKEFHDIAVIFSSVLASNMTLIFHFLFPLKLSPELLSSVASDIVKRQPRRNINFNRNQMDLIQSQPYKFNADPLHVFHILSNVDLLNEKFINHFLQMDEKVLSWIVSDKAPKLTRSIVESLVESSSAQIVKVIDAYIGNYIDNLTESDRTPGNFHFLMKVSDPILAARLIRNSKLVIGSCFSNPGVWMQTLPSDARNMIVAIPTKERQQDIMKIIYDFTNFTGCRTLRALLPPMMRSIILSDRTALFVPFLRSFYLQNSSRYDIEGLYPILYLKLILYEEIYEIPKDFNSYFFYLQEKIIALEILPSIFRINCKSWKDLRLLFRDISIMRKMFRILSQPFIATSWSKETLQYERMKWNLPSEVINRIVSYGFTRTGNQYSITAMID